MNQLDDAVQTALKGLLRSPLLIEDVTGDKLATFIVNKPWGVLTIAAIKAPGFENATAEQLGTTRKITLSGHHCR